MLRIGLTGGIGSGKSTVASILVRCGAGLVDTDAIARELTQPGGAAIPALRAHFGEAVVGADGALDRGRMRALVFSDASARASLEQLLHPLIAAEASRQATHCPHHAIVFDVPLLAESKHWRARVDRVLVVDCPESLQIERVVVRSGWTETTVHEVIKSQATRQARRAIADAIVDNGPEVSRPSLAQSVERLWMHWMRGA